MADASEFVIGAEVRYGDGAECGEVERIVIDRVAGTVTHLVVRVKHRRILDRLVPVGLVEAQAGGSGVRLSCSVEDFDKLDSAEKHHLPGSSVADYGPGQVSPLPVFAMRGLSIPSSPAAIIDEIVPFGEVDVRRGDRVRASDGEIGHVEGLVIDPSDRHVTHVLLQEGHLWGRRQVAIPVDTVKRVGDAVEVNLTKQQVHDLPSVEIDVSSEKG